MSSISPDLRNSLHAYVRQRSDLDILDEAAVARVTEAVATAFVADRECTWWWQALSAPAETQAYGTDDGLARVRALHESKHGDFTLVVTDDEAPPWEGVRGSLDGLIGMLREHPYFEYFVVDDSVSWVVFDTHHDCLVIVGDVN